MTSAKDPHRWKKKPNNIAKSHNSVKDKTLALLDFVWIAVNKVAVTITPRSELPRAFWIEARHTSSSRNDTTR